LPLFVILPPPPPPLFPYTTLFRSPVGRNRSLRSGRLLTFDISPPTPNTLSFSAAGSHKPIPTQSRRNSGMPGSSRHRQVAACLYNPVLSTGLRNLPFRKR